nr:MAG TPA: zinc-ribbon containing domain protein [Caudoviricetes sp.]
MTSQNKKGVKTLSKVEKAIKDFTKALNAFNTVCVKALQEKQEREKGCEYCDFSSGAVGATFDGEDDFFMIEHADGVNLCSDGKEFTLTKIKFCPMCGRKIGENDGGQTSN